MANLVQQLNDSAAGVVLGTALHTLGAIGLLGGLIGYIAWHRQLVRGHPNAAVLSFATFLTYLSIVVNLLGGFMRTYETGHPHITEFGSSAWVRAIAIKHVFLFAGMGAAVYLLERVAPRQLRAHRDGTLAQASMTGHRLGVLAVTLGIVVAAVLGAVSTILPVGAAEAVQDDVVDPQDAYHNATGTYQATPLAPGSAGGEFLVPAGATDLAITFTWTPTQANLGLQLVEPDGSPSRAFTGSGGSLDDALGRAPVAGTWTYRITSPDAIVNAQWTLAIHVPAGNGTHHDV